MDAFYEESAVNKNPKSGEKKYKILHIFSIVFLALAVIFIILFIFNIPIGSVESDDPELQQAVAMQRFIFTFYGFQAFFFISMWFVFYKLKSRCNVNYDYCFVSGELRISKVFNVNRRKLIARIDCADMIQVGDVDNSSYKRFCADPTIKQVVCTPNSETSNEKFFMYVYANYQGKKLFVLECRELLLMNIMKFAKRSVLESDYVMQERKQK